MIFLTSLRIAGRSLARCPGFALAAIVVLAMGLGVNTTLYAFLDAVLLAPMPGVSASTELGWIHWENRGGGQLTGLSHPDYLDLRAATTGSDAGVFAELAAYSPTPLSLGSGGSEPERVPGQLVSASFFALLGVEPTLGRFFSAAEDAPATTSPVVVLSDRLWRSRFAADSGVVGRRLVVNGKDFTVVGVAPPDFHGAELGAGAELWLPLAQTPAARPGSPHLLLERGAGWLAVLGRLAPDRSFASARAALGAVEAHLSADSSPDRSRRSLRLTESLGGLSPTGRRDLGPIAVLGVVAAGLVLLLVCSNVANLLLARALGRDREVRIRLALGAGRSRLVADLLAETVLLALAASGLALLFTVWASDLLMAALPRQDFAGFSAAPRPSWLLLTLVLALGSALLAGLGPALVATGRPTAAGALVSGARSRWPRRLVRVQLALSLALLTTAAASLSVIARAGAADLGFEPTGVLALSFDLELQGYSQTERRIFWDELLTRLAALPETRSASLANLAPLSGIMAGGWLSRAEADDPDEDGLLVFQNAVSPTYFETLGIPRLAGRAFGAEDRAGQPAGVILNRTAAQRLFSEEEAIGRRVRFDGTEGRLAEVVGVVQNSRIDEATEDPVAFAYLPLAQESVLGRTTLLVRWQGEPGSGLEALRRELAGLDSDLPVFDATTLPALARQRVDKQRAVSLLLSCFGALGLVLAAVGLFGLASQWVARRRPELGVRIALGAQPRDVQRLILGDCLQLAASGAGLGLLLSLAALPLLASALGSLAASDLWSFAGATAVLVTTSLGATWWPTRRALATDPVVVLRTS